MKHQSFSVLLSGSAALMLVLGTMGCSSRAAEKAPESPPAPPMTTTAAVEAPPPIVEVPPPVAMPPNVDPAFFEFDSHRLTESARATLDEAARVLGERPEVDVIIEGHCDERGTSEYNMALGEYRARAAQDYLVAAGVSPERIRIISYGKEKPFVEGHSEMAWARNRRAHFVVKQAALGELQTTHDLD